MDNLFDTMISENYEEDEDVEVFTEAYYPDNIEYLRMMKRKINLPLGSPIGRGNFAFLYTKSFDESIKMIKDRSNFTDRGRYKYYYFNATYIGRIYNKKFRYRLLSDRKDMYERISNETGCIGRKLIGVSKDNKNLYYDMFKYVEIFTSICYKLQPVRYIKYYWEYMKSIFNLSIDGYTNKFVLVDLKSFPLNKDIRHNLENPLFLIYYTAYRDISLMKDVDVDFFFFNGMNVIKVNPSQIDTKTTKKLRVEMNRIMHGITPADVLDKVTSDEELKKEELSAAVVSNIHDKTMDTPEEITSDIQLKALKAVSPVEREIKNKVDSKVDKTIELTKDTSIPKEDVEKALTTNVKKDLDADSEMLKQIYYQNKSKEPKKSAASTARDDYLRKAQKDLMIKDLSIDKIEKIKVNEIPIETNDVSNAVNIMNENMKEVRFENMNKTYIENVMQKDITDAILALNDKSIPLFIRDIKVEDSSDELNYKDTYTLYLEDGNRKRHTVKVDIPKFVDNKFMYLGGNKKFIRNQSFFLPIVKLAPNKVEIVTNYSKMTLERTENGTSDTERMFKLAGGNDFLKSCFKNGYAYSNNHNFVTTLEYDAYSKMFTSFKLGRTHIFFDQIEATTYAEKNGIKIPSGQMFIGTYKGENAFIDIDKQESKKGMNITDMILDSLPENIISEYRSVKSPKRLMLVKVKIMKQYMTVAMLLGLWVGLTECLKKLNIEYRLVDKLPELEPDEDFIKFADTIMVYKYDVQKALFMNGLKVVDTQKYAFADFDEKQPYTNYIIKVYGRAITENALMNFYEFVVDPITKEVLQELNLPDNIVDIYIYALKLLSDSQYTMDISQKLYRIRSVEIVPAILYERLAKNYVEYRNSSGKKKFTVPQNCVIKEVLAQKTVEDYSTLNPLAEMEMFHNVQTKGFRGVNLDEAYTMERRGCDDSMIGIISPSTAPDGGCGVSKTLSLEPTVTNIRGICEYKNEDLKDLKDVNLFSPGELSLPMCARVDDPMRLGHAIKQSSHVIPVKGSSPVLISNGMEEVSRFHLSSNFVINAEEDGEIIDYDEKLQIMIARYKSGKCQALNLAPDIVKNGGGGFFLSNVLKTDLKVGSKFKKNQVLAYHEDFFTNDEFNNCRMNMGPLMKVAIMSTYNTYEDGTVITHKMSEQCATEMCFKKAAVIGKNSNVFYIVKKGENISVGDPLLQFDTSYEDESINALLSSLSDENKEGVLEESRNEIKSKYSGVIEDIKIYSTVDLDDLSPSLRKIVASQYNTIRRKRDFLSKYDETPGTYKCGMLLSEGAHKVEPNQFGVIKGEQVDEGVLIEFYIKHSEPLEIGSKIA